MGGGGGHSFLKCSAYLYITTIWLLKEGPYDGALSGACVLHIYSCCVYVKRDSLARIRIPRHAHARTDELLLLSMETITGSTLAGATIVSPHTSSLPEPGAGDGEGLGGGGRGGCRVEWRDVEDPPGAWRSPGPVD